MAAGQWRLRGYVVEQLLGSGASADVWQARVGATGEAVALKRIVVRDDEQARRAHTEAALLSALDHPNLVRLHAVIAVEDSIVLVLDLAGRGSLRDLLAARGRLTPGELITALAPAAAAVAYLHNEQIVHGDVSAGNILFGHSGSPLLADVGVARLTGDERDAESSPLYIDPAVAAGSIPAPASDVFMLGAVAFHALTGTPLWQGGSPELTLAVAARGVPADVADRLRAAAVPEPMVAVLHRALARDPHRRGSAVEFALDLRHSATPVAVEFDAGRARPEPLARRDPDSDVQVTDAAYRPGERSVARPPDPARPGFERPGPAMEPVGAQPPTHLLKARPRPAIPRQRRPRGRPVLPRGRRGRPVLPRGRRGRPVLPRGRRGRPVLLRGRRGRSVLLRGRRGVLLTTAAVVVVLAAGLVAVVNRGDPPSAHRRPMPALSLADPVDPAATRGVRSSDPAPSTTAPSTTAPSTGARPEPVGERWRRVLSRLDAVRARAYATRDVALLRGVYARVDLFRADAAQLQRLVPRGCGLTGARTSFGAVLVSPVRGRAVLSVTARLPQTRLVCRGAVRATVPASGPRRLRIEIVSLAAGPRIAGQRLI